MAQKVLDYNELMFGVSNETFRYKTATITGGADLLKGSILTSAGVNTYHAAIDADKTGAAEIPNDWVVLLEDIAASGGDLPGKVGTSGGVWEDKLVAVVGLTYDENVKAKYAGSNVYVQNGTNSMAVAGEGA